MKRNSVKRADGKELKVDMKTRSILSVFVGCILIAFSASCENGPDQSSGRTNAEPVTTETQRAGKKWELVSAKEFLKISDIKKKRLPAGVYETEGYVIDSVPECECPPDAQCDREAASITISEQNKQSASDKLSLADLRILTDPKEFERGRKYKFKIKMTEYDFDDDPRGEFFYVFYVAHRDGG
ncbi:MAG: hypothetical protein R2681_03160 [Pyrinomonadaceae bacterium]